MKYILIFFQSLLLYSYSYTQIEPPAIDWVNTFGGLWDDYIGGTVVDKYGNVYLAGEFEVQTCFTEFDCLISQSGIGYTDIYLVKYDPLGNFVWGKSFGGDSSEAVIELKLSPKGGVILGGSFRNKLIVDSLELYSQKGADYSSFISWIDPSGTIQGLQAFNGSYFDPFQQLAVDSANNIWVAGISVSDTLFFNQGYFTKDTNFTTSFYVVALSWGQGLLSKKRITPSSDGFPKVIENLEITHNNELYLTGYFGESIILGSDTLSMGESSHYFLFSLSNNGTWNLSSIYPSNSFSLYDIITSNDDAIFMVGSVNENTNFGGVVVPASSTVYKYFVLKYSGGTTDWVITQTEQKRIKNISRADSSIYVLGGFTNGYNLFDTTFYAIPGQSSDLFIACLDEAVGSLRWVRQVGGPGPEGPGFIRASEAGLYLSGGFGDNLTYLDTFLLVNSFPFTSEGFISKFKTEFKLTNIEDENFNKVVVYPNPFEDRLYITNPRQKNISGYRIISLSGNILFERENLSQGIDQLTIEIPEIQNITRGMYFISIYSGDNVRTQKLIKM